MEQPTSTTLVRPTAAGGLNELGESHRQPVRRGHLRLPQHGEELVCDLAEALEHAIALGRNRAAARDIRLHAYIVGNLCVADDQYAALRTLDAMLAMATAMAAWGSVIVCQAMEERGQVLVRLQFAGEPARCQTNELAILDCSLRREWPRIPPCH